MPVIPLTITVSLCLVFTFVIFFLRENSRRFSNAERESLLPFNDETPRVAGAGTRATDDDGHDHAHGDSQCGCRSGPRDPCSGCLKRPDATADR